MAQIHSTITWVFYNLLGGNSDDEKSYYYLLSTEGLIAYVNPARKYIEISYVIQKLTNITITF